MSSCTLLLLLVTSISKLHNLGIRHLHDTEVMQNVFPTLYIPIDTSILTQHLYRSYDPTSTYITPIYGPTSMYITPIYDPTYISLLYMTQHLRISLLYMTQHLYHSYDPTSPYQYTCALSSQELFLVDISTDHMYYKFIPIIYMTMSRCCSLPEERDIIRANSSNSQRH